MRPAAFIGITLFVLILGIHHFQESPSETPGTTSVVPPPARAPLSTTGTIQLVLVDLDGQPVSGAHGFLRRPDANRELSPAISGESGRLELEVAPETRGEILIDHIDGFADVPYPAIYRGEHLDLGRVTLLPVGVIKGEVKDPEGNPVVGADVFCPQSATSAATDADGRFVLECRRRQTELRIFSPDFVPHQVRPFITPGQVKELPIQLSRGPRFRGVVVRDDGSPVIADLELFSEQEKITVRGTADSEGRFALPPIHDEQLTLTVSDGRYTRVYHGGSVSDLPREITWPRQFDIQLRVWDRKRRPVHGARARLDHARSGVLTIGPPGNDQGGNTWDRTFPAPEDSHIIRIPYEPFLESVVVTAPGFLPTYAQLTDCQESDPPIDVALQRPPTYGLTVRVEDAAGSPLPEVTIDIAGRSGVTNAQGMWSALLPRPGSTRRVLPAPQRGGHITVSRPGFATISRSIDPGRRGEHEATFTLRRASRILVDLLDEDGSPANGMCAQLAQGDPDHDPRYHTVGSVCYIENIAAGFHRVEILDRLTGYVRELEPVTLGPGHTERRQVMLPAAVEVEVEILKASGNRMHYVPLLAESAHESKFISHGPDFIYRFRTRDRGEFRLSMKGEAFVREVQGPTRLTLQLGQVRGVLLSPAGKPLADTEIHFLGKVERSARTDENGVFRDLPLPRGHYRWWLPAPPAGVFAGGTLAYLEAQDEITIQATAGHPATLRPLHDGDPSPWSVTVDLGGTSVPIYHGTDREASIVLPAHPVPGLVGMGPRHRAQVEFSPAVTRYEPRLERWSVVTVHVDPLDEWISASVVFLATGGNVRKAHPIDDGSRSPHRFVVAPGHYRIQLRTHQKIIGVGQVDTSQGDAEIDFRNQP